MGLNIKNETTERLAHELARATGESLTTAITVAVRERRPVFTGDYTLRRHQPYDQIVGWITHRDLLRAYHEERQRLTVLPQTTLSSQR